MTMEEAAQAIAMLRIHVARELRLRTGNDCDSNPAIAAAQELVVAQYVTAFIYALGTEKK